MSRHPLFLSLAVVALIGCDCKGTQPNPGLQPDFIANPTILSFESCPAQDEDGAPIADVFPTLQTFTIENIGRVAGQLSVSIQGKDAALFKVVESSLVESIGSGEQVEIKVQFAPLKAGDATAELVIDDGSDLTDPVKVTLSGSGSTLPAQPSIKIFYEDKDSHQFVECPESFNGSIDNCLVQWPDTFKGQNASLKMKIKNLGCPTLKITGFELVPFTSDADVQFFIDKPTVPPSVPNPQLLSLADGTQEMDAEIRFSPADDGTSDGQRYAYVKVLSNSGKSPESLITLFGYAAEPSLYTSPSFCDYTDPDDTCNGTKVQTTGMNAKSVFQVTNGGNTTIHIEKVAFRNANHPRFAIGGENPEGQDIGPGESKPLEILYTDAPLFKIELLDITGSAGGMPTNTATIRLQGGVLPCLDVVPGDKLDFSDTTGNAEKPVQICNKAMNAKGLACGDLTVSNLQVSQGDPFFKLKNPSPTNSTVAPGECVTATILFAPPVTGGQMAGTLDINTNDPDYTPYRLSLYSKLPHDQRPEAVLQGPDPERRENTMSAKLIELNPKELLLHGEESYDPPNKAPVAQYKFFLQPPVGAAVPTDADLLDPVSRMSVHNKVTTNGQVILQFKPNAMGQYKTGKYTVYLTVYDNAGQASTAQSLEIDVRQ